MTIDIQGIEFYLNMARDARSFEQTQMNLMFAQAEAAKVQAEAMQRIATALESLAGCVNDKWLRVETMDKAF